MTITGPQLWRCPLLRTPHQLEPTKSDEREPDLVLPQAHNKSRHLVLKNLVEVVEEEASNLLGIKCRI